MDKYRREVVGTLGETVIGEVGEARWKSLLQKLAAMEETIGGVLRRLPRNEQKEEEIYVCPLMLFAPDRDRDGRAFVTVDHGGLLYADRHSGNGAALRRYSICPEADMEWWRRLNEQKRETVISYLGYIVLSLGKDGSAAQFVRQTLGKAAPDHELTEHGGAEERRKVIGTG